MNVLSMHALFFVCLLTFAYFTVNNNMCFTDKINCDTRGAHCPGAFGPVQMA